MRPANRQRSRNQYTCAHRKSSRRGTATASRKTLNAFKWGTLAISFYHPAGAKPGSEEGSCVCSFTGTNPCCKASEHAIPFWYWSFDDAAAHLGCNGQYRSHGMTPCFIFVRDPLNSGSAGANADVSKKIGEFLGIGNWRKARAARADKRLRFFGMKLRQGFAQGAGQSFEIR